MPLIDIRTTTITSKGQVVIPNELRQQAGFNTGSRLAVISYGDHVELIPMKNIEEKLATAIASEKSLAEHWNSPEDEEAWKDL